MTARLRARARWIRRGLAFVVGGLVLVACSTQSVAFHGQVGVAGPTMTITDATGNLLDVDFQPNVQLETPIEAGMGQFPGRPTRYGIWWTVTDDCDGDTTMEITRSGQSITLEVRRPNCDGPNPRTVQIAIDVRQPFDMQWTTLRVTDT